MILVCGEALYDVFVEEETPTGARLDARIGGANFNVAVGLARLGRPAGLFTGLSRDLLGERLARALREEGVDDRRLVRKDELTTLAVVGLGADGGARYAFHGIGAADRAVTPDETPADLEGVEALHFGCFTLVVEPTGSTFLGLARREAGRRLISLDPNVRPTVEPDLGKWRERVEAFAALADLIKISEDDRDLLYPDETPADLAARWRAGGTAIVVETRGGQGAVAWGPDGEIGVPAEKIAVVDTVGAGDTFLAALLDGLAGAGQASPEGIGGVTAETLRRILRRAAAAAAVACSRRGADLPRAEDLPPL